MLVVKDAQKKSVAHGVIQAGHGDHYSVCPCSFSLGFEIDLLHIYIMMFLFGYFLYPLIIIVHFAFCEKGWETDYYDSNCLLHPKLL